MIIIDILFVSFFLGLAVWFLVKGYPNTAGALINTF